METKYDGNMTANVSSVLQASHLKMHLSKISDWLRGGQLGNGVNIELIDCDEVVGQEVT